MPDVAVRLLVDWCAAGLASASISPIIFVIDKSIMEAASGRSKTIVSSIATSTSHMFKQPHTFFSSLPFLLLYSVYFATYTTANVFDTLSSLKSPDWSIQTTSYGKFLATTSVNLSSCVFKDFHYAKMFGTGVPRPMPLSSLALFSARDSLTVFASFNVPALLAPTMGLNAAQLVTPCAMQLVSTPMHLMGLDIYNREGRGLRDRLGAVGEGYWKSTLARMCRILPAFGVAGIINRETRAMGMHLAQQ